jgi:uncharacterized membrane protein
MGKRFEVTRSVTIHRPVEAVYAFATDPLKDRLWRKGVWKTASDRPGPPAIGTQTTETLRFMWRTVITRSEIIEAIPNRKLAFRSISGPLPVTGYRRFEPQGGGTTFTYHLEGEVDGLFAVLSPVLTPLFNRQIAADLQRLKAHLEREGT